MHEGNDLLAFRMKDTFEYLGAVIDQVRQYLVQFAFWSHIDCLPDQLLVVHTVSSVCNLGNQLSYLLL